MSRIILHVDMNSYFASVEQAANPFYKGKPIAVGGGTGGKTTIVAAASYEAKARGVKTAMPAWEAKRICPELIIVSGDMDKYIYTSSEIIKILKEYTPLVEVFSIDEAFLDVTDTAAHFAQPEQSGEIAIAKEIKRKIRERFKITCSIGIGPNKLLAKLAGELKKPDGLTVLTAESFLARVKDLPVDEMCGIGRKMKKHLAALRVAGGNGIHTIGELHNCPREVLIKRFGPAYGEQLWLMGQGRDSSYGNGVPVDPNRNFEIAKSVGHSFTMPKFTTDLDLVKGYLLKLSEQVGRRMRKEKYKGRVVHLALGFGNFKFWAKQKKLEDYIDDGADIYREAEKLLQIAVDLRLGEPRYDRRGIDDGTVKGFRFVGVNVSDLLCQMDPISLLPEREQNKQVLKAVDAINDRFGEGTVQRLATLRAKMGEKVGMTSREKYILRPN